MILIVENSPSFNVFHFFNQVFMDLNFHSMELAFYYTLKFSCILTVMFFLVVIWMQMVSNWWQQII